MLCPWFFTYKQKPVKKTCFAVDRATNRFRAYGLLVQETRVYVLLHELVHIYIGTVIDQNQQRVAGEVMTLNECWSLSGASARYNPSNFAFYVNSKFTRTPPSANVFCDQYVEHFGLIRCQFGLQELSSKSL